MPLKVFGSGDAASPATRAAAETPASAASGRASYTRPTPSADPPRMMMDHVEPLGLDWARRAAQAVVAHARFMEWVAQPKSADAEAGLYVVGESPGTDLLTAFGAYREIAADEVPARPALTEAPAAKEAASLVIMRKPVGAG